MQHDPTIAGDNGGDGNSRSVSYELFIAAITIISLINTVIWFFFRDSNLADIAISIDVLLSVILLFDFATRLYRAPERGRYMVNEFGWADLLGSLPLHLFPWTRLFRLLRLATSLRRLNRMGARGAWDGVLRSRSGSSLAVATLALILMLEFGSMFVLRAEEDQPTATITTGEEAVWWGIGTVTTVGYGDYTPVTGNGRLAAVLLMVVGIGLATVMTGYLANLFLRFSSHPSENAPLAEEVAEMKQTLDDLHATVAEFQQRLLDRETQLPTEYRDTTEAE